MIWTVGCTNLRGISFWPYGNWNKLWSPCACLPLF